MDGWFYINIHLVGSGDVRALCALVLQRRTSNELTYSHMSMEVHCFVVSAGCCLLIVLPVPLVFYILYHTFCCWIRALVSIRPTCVVFSSAILDVET